MTGYGTATAEVVRVLEAEGLSASSDPAVLDLPGVWVTPGTPSISWEYQDGQEYVGRWDLYLLAPDLDPVNSLDHLTALVQTVRDVFSGSVTEATAVTIQLTNHAAEPLPALLITLDQKVT